MHPGCCGAGCLSTASLRIGKVRSVPTVATWNAVYNQGEGAVEGPSFLSLGSTFWEFEIPVFIGAPWLFKCLDMPRIEMERTDSPIDTNTAIAGHRCHKMGLRGAQAYQCFFIGCSGMNAHIVFQGKRMHNAFGFQTAPHTARNHTTWHRNQLPFITARLLWRVIMVYFLLWTL